MSANPRPTHTRTQSGRKVDRVNHAGAGGDDTEDGHSPKRSKQAPKLGPCTFCSQSGAGRQQYSGASTSSAQLHASAILVAYADRTGCGDTCTLAEPDAGSHHEWVVAAARQLGTPSEFLAHARCYNKLTANKAGPPLLCRYFQ